MKAMDSSLKALSPVIALVLTGQAKPITQVLPCPSAGLSTEMGPLPMEMHLPGEGTAPSAALEKSGMIFGKGMLMVLPL